MIIFYHNNSKITEIVSTKVANIPNEIGKNIVLVLLEFATKFDDEILVWCCQNQKENLNIDEIKNLFHHKKMMLSYSPNLITYFPRELGYIEDSPYIKIPKDVKYGTWQMSSQVGAVHASVIQACRKDLIAECNFNYFLNSLAKRAMTFGLLCYSEPKLLKINSEVTGIKDSNLNQLFKFTKQHYRLRWVFLLFFNLCIYEKRFPLFPFLASLICEKRKFHPELLDQIPLESNKKIIEKGTIDVLIPTIGRKEYLLNVLHNLASQTHLPVNVIIVEQNTDETSVSELNYIVDISWPFKIKHHFTHQSGACNARNIALKYVESEFVFFADDDIFFEDDLIEKAMQSFQLTGNEVILVSCHLKTQKIVTQNPKQFPVFGAGHAFVKSNSLKDLKFNMAYEFGFGEDNDFGMQLRSKGYDILYISTSKILHLKAPMGGFRTKPILKWNNEPIQPKPSPTVMIYRLKYDTKEQLLSYKTILFFKNINSSFFLNPINYIRDFRRKWAASVYWANELNKYIK
jgi:glycosyltransferase involved in cell wall biosynthesis